jgi:serpin B
MKKILSVVLLPLCMLIFASLASGKKINHYKEAKPDKPDAGQQVSTDTGSVEFANRIFGSCADKDDNLFLSPHSIRTALQMTYEGASGATASEMRKVLHLSPDNQQRRQSQLAIAAQINRPNDAYQLSSVNAIWVEQTARLVPEFEGLVKQTYGGSVKQVDFLHKAEDSRLVINAWVEEKTNERIKNLIPPNSLTPVTRMVLTNAIYFKGTWQKAFDKDLSYEANFYDRNRVAGKVMMMQKEDEQSIFPYFEDQFGQYIELPYAGEALSMQVILPAMMREENMSDAGLLTHFLKIEKKLQLKRVDVALPRFKIENKFELTKVLMDLGMNKAFDDGAEFYNMCESESLKIASVIHQSFVEVNESGTEAAAATAIIMAVTDSKEAPSTTRFRADKPFLFIIRHKASGEILFLGKKNKA